MSDKTLISATAIIVIGALEITALIMEVDGAAFGLVIAAISGIAGYQVRAVKDKIVKL